MRTTQAAIALLLAAAPALAQDVRGFERCMVERQIERRTGCLQANIELLQQTLDKTSREAQRQVAAANREIAAMRAEIAAAGREIAALQETLGKLLGRIEELEKARK